MPANFSYWIWGTIITQLLTAIFHSISFFVKEKPGNETEKQLIELVKDYKIEMGAGIKRSFGQLFIGVSACFTMIYILGAVINWYLLQTTVGPAVWKGLILIELLAYGIVFLLQIKFTFLPPIIVTGLVFLFLAGTYFIYNWP
ncbi:MAG: LIC_13387 family protein [Chitinophagaceae bacterium]